MTTDVSEPPTADELIQAWRDGDIDIDDAEKVEDIDALTIQVNFATQDGPVYLTYSLAEELSYRPSEDGEYPTDTDRFNILEDE
jgi:hypothetical protein